MAWLSRIDAAARAKAAVAPNLARPGTAVEARMPACGNGDIPADLGRPLG
jgi:hypothetical protein